MHSSSELLGKMLKAKMFGDTALSPLDNKKFHVFGLDAPPNYRLSCGSLGPAPIRGSGRFPLDRYDIS